MAILCNILTLSEEEELTGRWPKIKKEILSYNVLHILTVWRRGGESVYSSAIIKNETKAIIAPGRTWTCNLQIRSLLPYPLGHRSSIVFGPEFFLTISLVFQPGMQYCLSKAWRTHYNWSGQKWSVRKPKLVFWTLKTTMKINIPMLQLS